MPTTTAITTTQPAERTTPSSRSRGAHGDRWRCSRSPRQSPAPPACGGAGRRGCGARSTSRAGSCWRSTSTATIYWLAPRQLPPRRLAADPHVRHDRAARPARAAHRPAGVPHAAVLLGHRPEHPRRAHADPRARRRGTSRSASTGSSTCRSSGRPSTTSSPAATGRRSATAARDRLVRGVAGDRAGGEPDVRRELRLRRQHHARAADRRSTRLGPWPLRVYKMIVAVLVLFVAMWLPWAIADRRRRDRERLSTRTGSGRTPPEAAAGP